MHVGSWQQQIWQHSPSSTVTTSMQTAGPSGPVTYAWAPLRRWSLSLPSWSVLPLISTLVACVCLAAMIPMYIAATRLHDANDTPLTEPQNLALADFQHGRPDMVLVGLSLILVQPALRSVSFTADISLGPYMSDPRDGVVELSDGCYLMVIVGRQRFKVESGDALDSLTYNLFLGQTVPFFQYPFDEYTLNLTIRATLVNTTTTPNQKTAVAVGVLLLGSAQGWNTQPSLAPATPGNPPQPGVVMVMYLERSMSVKFFSMFVVIVMWLISLGMFSIALNFALSSGLEMSCEIPALAVGLLFALPFVRDIQPDAPTVGVTVDVMGFFFNMLLVAIATIMALAALSSRYYRSLKIEDRRRMGQNHGSEQLVNNGLYKDHQTSANGLVVPEQTNRTTV